MKEIRKKMCLNQRPLGSGEVVKSRAVEGLWFWSRGTVQ